MSSEELNELISALSATPLRIQSLLANVPPEELRRRPSADEFSFVESVCHLRDIEVEGYTPRIRKILSEDKPILLDIDGGLLAIDREYHRQDVSGAWQTFAQARAENLATLNKLAPEELMREGALEGAGTINLQQLLIMMANHDASHLADMEQIQRRTVLHSAE